MIVQHIPLNKLRPSAGNARKTAPDFGIETLAANIQAVGLIQNLCVRPAATGDKFEVVAGRRRLLALQRLAKDKAIGKAEEIACNVLGDGEDPAEISLAENVMREPMHPSDQFAAFKQLADAGKGPEEIAARFGCSALTVRQRLKLAAVSPILFDLYRQDGMTLDQLMAFTVSDDHAAQETVWQELPDWNRHAATIRRNLTRAQIAAGDPRVRFVGIDAYVAAGGGLIRDLFADEHAGYLTDPALLDRLVGERLEREAEAIRGEGWKWVEIIAAAVEHDALRRFRRIYPEREPVGEEQQAEIDLLSARYDALTGEHGDEPPEAIAAELERISDAIDALSQGATHWLADDIARAGAILGIGYSGNLAVERGLLRPEDVPDEPPASRTRLGSGASGRAARSAELPAPLVEDLTAHRTAALRATLAQNPEIALIAVVHALALKCCYGFGAQSCLSIGVESADLSGSAEGIEHSAAAQKLAARSTFWRDRLPAASDALWGWLAAQDNATRLDLLAYCAAGSVNAVVKPHDRHDDRLVHADQLAAALSLDMTEWWQPTAGNYLARVSKARILAAVAEGVSPQASENLAKLKKAALVEAAEERLTGTFWLPALLRLTATPAVMTPPQPEAIAAE